MASFRMTVQDLLREVISEPDPFPKYTSQIVNLANQNAQGTRPKVVGQLSDLIQKFPGKNYSEWADWYLKHHPDAIDKATDLIWIMLEGLKTAIEMIDRTLVHRWVTDLVLKKTFVGFRFQNAILRRLAAQRGLSFRPATPEEESRGIDGFLGAEPASVKPSTYRSKPMLQEQIRCRIVYYTKKKGGLIVECDF